MKKRGLLSTARRRLDRGAFDPQSPTRKKTVELIESARSAGRLLKNSY